MKCLPPFFVAEGEAGVQYLKDQLGKIPPFHEDVATEMCRGQRIKTDNESIKRGDNKDGGAGKSTPMRARALTGSRTIEVTRSPSQIYSHSISCLRQYYLLANSRT